MNRHGQRSVNLRGLLMNMHLQASAPGRIDCGGTWDLKALAIPDERFHPATVNLAVNLRTRVELAPYQLGKVLVSSDGYPSEEAPAHLLPFDTPLRLVFSILSYFGVSGVHVKITSEIPPRSGLGGSGVLAVAVIGVLGKALEILGVRPPLSTRKIALLAHTVEDGMHISLTGLQDQLAAVYGGIHKWIWQYSQFTQPYTRQQLITQKGYSEIQKRIVIAYTGDARNSSLVTSKYLQSFAHVSDRPKWREMGKLVDEFADALSNGDWLKAANVLREEASIRDALLPEGISPLAIQLRESANQHHCGAAFTGGNRGGCVWAIGEENAIAEVRTMWQTITKNFKRSCILDADISPKGLVIEYHPRDKA